MAVLSDADRAAAAAEFMSDLSAERFQLAGLTKADVRAALDAADLWADLNATAYNLALPQPFRGAVNAALKTRLLTFVIRRRWQAGA